MFRWDNLILSSFWQGGPSLGALILVAYAFKFALYAQINQGVIPSLFTIVSLYVAITFYFKFTEVISNMKIFGILLMIPCVVFIVLDPKPEFSDDGTLTGEEMRLYGLIAVLFALLCPILWTIKSFMARLAFENGQWLKQNALDLAVDQLIYRSIFSVILYGIFLTYNPFVWDEFYQG